MSVGLYYTLLKSRPLSCEGASAPDKVLILLHAF